MPPGRAKFKCYRPTCPPRPLERAPAAAACNGCEACAASTPAVGWDFI